MKDIERAVKNKFQWVGSPQPLDIVKTAAESCIESVEDVDDKVFPFFESTAIKLINDLGAKEALCAALAVITGHTKPMKARSLLSNTEGFITCQFVSSKPMQSVGCVWGALRRVWTVNITDAIRGMQLTTDECGAVFDVPSQYRAQIDEAINTEEWLKICTSLPELKERHVRENGGNNRGFGGGRGFSGSRGFGGRGGSGRGGFFNHNGGGSGRGVFRR